MTYLQYLRQYAYHIACMLLILTVSIVHSVYFIAGFMAVTLAVILIGSYLAFKRI
jgi:hypothetical protein